MPRINGQTNRASAFLRSFLKSPAGPPPDKWPTPAVLRRWLRRPSFRAAFASLQDTLHLQTDFHLAAATTKSLNRFLNDDSPLSTQDPCKLLRLSHLRQRFAASNILSDDQDDEPSPRRITRLDVMNNLHLVNPEFRLNPDELRHVARNAGYPIHLRDIPEFPPPTEQDTFYYRLIMDPSALLWYLKLYGEKTGDHRHSHIVTNCKHLIPMDDPSRPLPCFRESSEQTTADAPQPQPQPQTPI